MPRSSVSKSTLLRIANRVLDGVGDPGLGEWVEHHKALHVRRRLTEAEALITGPVLDIRRTDEARQRSLALGSRLRFVPAEILENELGGTSL